MKILASLALVVGTAGISLAQTASLTANSTVLAAAGGTVTLTANVAYEGEPGAIGWSVVLPADWSLVTVSGPNVPQIAPDAGSSGTLEFAYTTSPANGAQFSMTVRYPANAPAATARPTVLVRTGGKLSTLTPSGIEWRRAGLETPRKSHN